MSPALTARERNTVDLLVSARTGVVRSLEPWRSNPDEPTLPVFYVAHLADGHLRPGGNAASVANGLMGVGKGTDEAGAMRRALGEAVERYCCTQLDPSTMLLATEAELGSSAITPGECVLYSESQYRHGEIRYRRHDPHQPIRWVPARSQCDDEWFVPASLTYLCVNGELADETWCYNTSNGVAAGPDPAMARLGGLLELIERDAYLITWMHRLPAARIDLDPLDGLTAHVVSHYAARRIEVHAFDVSVDIAVPVMMALAVDRSGNGPAAVVGLGCDLDPGIALDKALLELCQGRMGETWRYHNDGSSTHIQVPADVSAIRDHSALFFHPAMLGELEFLLDTPRAAALDEIPNGATGDTARDLTRCVGLLEAAGSRVAFADITTPDVASAGLSVVRTIATDLQPIHFGYRTERLGGRRLYEVPCRLGVGAGPRTERELNRCPHPLP